MRTVALEATLESVVVLGLLVLIRIFLSWALLVEIEGHWPWKAGARAQEERRDGRSMGEMSEAIEKPPTSVGSV